MYGGVCLFSCLSLSVPINHDKTQIGSLHQCSSLDRFTHGGMSVTHSEDNGATETLLSLPTKFLAS